MASLALMVALIFLATIVLGPLALILSLFGFKWMAVLLGVSAVALGAFWCSVAPFPVSVVGALSALCGALAIRQRRI